LGFYDQTQHLGASLAVSPRLFLGSCRDQGALEGQSVTQACRREGGAGNAANVPRPKEDCENFLYEFKNFLRELVTSLTSSTAQIVTKPANGH